MNRTLVGPKDVIHSWTVDGVTYTAEHGEVKPVPPDHHVDQRLFGFGYAWDEDGSAKTEIERQEKVRLETAGRVVVQQPQFDRPDRTGVRKTGAAGRGE